jgi:LmbE family N-acetylglucosaminyl deacetylase
MIFNKKEASIYIPDGLPLDIAIQRITHMGIGAHQDDLEIMAFHGVMECFGQADKWFAGVDVTNGSGSARSGLYESYTDEQMVSIRRIEQKKASFVGEYALQVLLEYTSAEVKDADNRGTVEDIKTILSTCKPKILYTHNLADKHDTHVSTAIRIIQAIRELPEDLHPQKVYGCEAWRDLDWLCDEDKLLLDCSGREHLASALTGVFDSQIAGGKRYDLASVARRRANATYLASHNVDTASEIAFAMDLTPTIQNPEIDLAEYAVSYINKFAMDVTDRIKKFF